MDTDKKLPRIIENARRLNSARFITPLSLDEAEQRRTEEAAKVGEIQTQLGDKDWRDSSGNRADAHEYWAWRKKASWALQLSQAELRSLNAWIKNVNRAAQTVCTDGGSIDVDPRDPHKMLVAALRVLKRIAAETDIDPEERAVIDALQEAVRHSTAQQGISR